jgi:hypothetical protein
LLQQAEAYGKLAAKRALELGLPAPSHLNKPKVLDAQSGLLAEEEKQNRRAGGMLATATIKNQFSRFIMVRYSLMMPSISSEHRGFGSLRRWSDLATMSLGGVRKRPRCRRSLLVGPPSRLSLPLPSSAPDE